MSFDERICPSDAENCIRIGQREPISMETLYADISALGAVFGIRERAKAMISSLKARVAAIEDELGRGCPARPAMDHRQR